MQFGKSQYFHPTITGILEIILFNVLAGTKVEINDICNNEKNIFIYVLANELTKIYMGRAAKKAEQSAIYIFKIYTDLPEINL